MRRAREFRNNYFYRLSSRLRKYIYYIIIQTAQLCRDGNTLIAETNERPQRLPIGKYIIYRMYF